MIDHIGMPVLLSVAIIGCAGTQRLTQVSLRRDRSPRFSGGRYWMERDLENQRLVETAMEG